MCVHALRAFSRAFASRLHKSAILNESKFDAVTLKLTVMFWAAALSAYDDKIRFIASLLQYLIKRLFSSPVHISSI